MSVLKVTEDNFDDVVDHSLVVIDFWATWCKPCRSFAKVMEKIAGEYPGVTFGNINIEEEKALAAEFQIMSVPAVMILRDRVVVYAEPGAMTAVNLRELIEKAKGLTVT